MATEGTGAAPVAAPEAPAAQGGLDDFDALVAQDPGASVDVPADGTEGGSSELDAAAAAAEAEMRGEDPEAADDAPLDPDSEVEIDPDESPAEVEPIHGLEPDAILDAIKAGEIPAELMDKLTITQTIDGEDVRVTLEEARKNGMRLSHYSRKNNALAEDKRAFEGARDDFAQMVRSWKDNTPQGRSQTLQMLEDWITPEVLHELVQDYATEYTRIQSLSPEGQAEYHGRRKAEREARQARLDAQRAMREAQSKRDNDGGQKIQQQIAQMRDAALTRLGIQGSAYVHEIYIANLRGLWNASDKKGPITPDMAADAAQATKEDLDRLSGEMRKSKETTAKVAAQKSKLAAKPQPRGGGKPTSPTRVKRAGPADFDRIMGLD